MLILFPIIQLPFILFLIVACAQIASLTLMKDSERLDLLKEIGGTRVYEERRRESLKIMHETSTSSPWYYYKLSDIFDT